ncbi:complexin-1-like [Lagopus leucura]|uniref:complexin-1-like n=1 Tax=Lagopus leucura TaxID=30410 RepID=UPI001C67D6CC|nr:complexin-1-like [Lagopus leucura]
MDLVFTNREGLVENVELKGSLGCSDYEMVEFKILKAVRRAPGKLSSLDFVRAGFDLFKDLLGRYGIKKKEEKEAEAQAALDANAEGSLTRPKKAIPPGCGEEEEEEEESILDTVIKYLPGPLQDMFKK